MRKGRLLMNLENFDDLVKDPKKYGLPTFEEFCKNPKAFRKNPEESFLHAETGSTIFYKNVKHRWFIDGFECKSLEEVERIARDQGYEISDLDLEPEIIPAGGGKAEFHVKFVNKPKGRIIT